MRHFDISPLFDDWNYMSFSDFWAKYPRKVAKKVAENAWKRLSAQEQSDAIEALDNHIAYWKLKDTATEYIPHASSWLNQGRWEDELDMTVKEQKKPELPWYVNDEMTLKKGQELGINPNPGETMAQYRQRIHTRLGQGFATKH